MNNRFVPSCNRGQLRSLSPGVGTRTADRRRAATGRYIVFDGLSSNTERLRHTQSVIRTNLNENP